MSFAEINQTQRKSERSAYLKNNPGIGSQVDSDVEVVFRRAAVVERSVCLTSANSALHVAQHVAQLVPQHVAQ